MQEFGNYRLTEKLQETKYTEIYRGVNKTTNTSFVLKILKSEFPTPEFISKLKAEYQILSQINSPFVIKAFSLEQYDKHFGIILEDIAGKSLKDFLNSSLSLADFFKIAIPMVRAIDAVHKNNVIHKDINPSNFIFNPNTKELRLIDFGISTTFTRENSILESSNILEGTLNYISPEQTGRMNRSLDYRTDFYSLGITFYEFLTGKLPFTFSDPMELIHSHIAKQPTQPVELDSTIPIPLSDLVMKLILKTAEDRYQSCHGILYDLEMISSGINDYTSEFPSLATKDFSDKFQIPQKLYGREKEIEILLSAFDRISNERTEMLILTGYSGIGKSSLVSEIYKPITEKRGYFISGKFDQYNRNIPYHAFLNIFQDLTKQLLGETKSRLDRWRDRIKKALGDNAQVVVEAIPDLELIIGKQKPVPELPINDSQNRFNIVFQKFIKLFTSSEHPLVIFLDDLQWADGASLNLLELLMHSNTLGLLLIAAYRDNEVSNLHPLHTTLDEIKKEGANISYISLSPLSLEIVEKIISDTLKTENNTSKPLAELVFKKTAGNPFFMNEFLKSLYSEKLIVFESDTQAWKWDLDKINKRDFTDNVVELMAYKIKQLNPDCQRLLQLAACIGNQFTINILSLVSELNNEDTLSKLFPSIAENFIFSLGLNQDTISLNSKDEDNENKTQEFKFAHDRIQQAAYSLIPDEKRLKTHFQIGRILEKRISKETLEEKIFTVVNQLNHGISFLNTGEEKIHLANLNIIASKKARAATAYEATLEYAKIGISLLGFDAWEKDYDLTLELYNLAAESSSLLGELSFLNNCIDTITQKANTALHQVNAYSIKIQSLASQNKFQDTIETAKLILEKLGTVFPDNPTPDDFFKGINEISHLMGNKKVEELVNLPKMVAPEKLAVMNIAASLIPTAYNAGSPLFPLLIILMVNLSIQFGNSPISTFGYTNYGILLCNLMKDIPRADEFRKLAYKLAMEPESKPFRAGTLTGIGIFLLHRTSHLKETIPLLQSGFQLGLETGALEIIGYTGYAICLNSFWTGEPLKQLCIKITSYRDTLKNLNQLTGAIYCNIFLETTLSLLSSTNQELSNNPDFFKNDESILEETKSSGDRTRLFYFYLQALSLNFILDEIELATVYTNKIKKFLVAGGGTIAEAILYFYDSLILLHKMEEQPLEDNIKYPEDLKISLSRIEENQKNLRLWSEFAGMNHLHRYVLVEAEIFRVSGKFLEASNSYDRAIELAHKNGFIQDEAIANELAFRFWLRQNKKDFAQLYLQKAYYSYSLWGATKKLENLQLTYPSQVKLINDFQENAFNTGTIISGMTTTGKMEANLSLDFMSIMKASQIISGEIILEKLISSLMKVLVENAGAEKGVLFLEDDGEISVVAKWESKLKAVDILNIPADNGYSLYSPSVVNFVSRTSKNLVIENLARDEKFKDDYITKYNPNSVLCIPLIKQGKLIGIIYLENNLTSGAFTKDRIEIIKMLSSQAAISLENARLYSNLENITKEKTKVITEMEIARDIQTSLLPKNPVLSGFEVATYMHTAEMVGGDYYDIISAGGKEWFVIGDVSGHGVTAGLIMMMAQTAIHTILNSVDSKNPAELLQKVNLVISANIKKMNLNKYMTLTLFLKDEDGNIYYSGMHQDLLLYSAKEKIVHIKETNGSWLGYFELYNDYPLDHIKMEKDDVLLLFTDGITESINNSGDMFDLNGLAKLLNDSGNNSVMGIKEKILNSLKQYKTEDDITFMILKKL